MENTGILEDMKYFPLLVGRSSLGKELSNDEYNDLWKVFYTLPEEIKGVFAAPEMSERIKMLQKERGISDEAIEVVSAIIREYFLFKKDAVWLENALLAKLERKDVSFVKEYIQKNILSIKPAPKVSEEDTAVQSVKTLDLPLLDALSKYQRLSEQTVTEDRIVVKGEGQPVRGSIRNWLRHYRDAVGIRKHSAMERGQFLFQGENTKRLPAPDREKLSLLFRSLDENMPISIDVERQEVIFPAFEEKPKVDQSSSEEKVIPTLGTSFRPIEKFPASALPIKKALEWNTEKTVVPPLFGNVPAPPRPEITSSKPSGVSAPVYAIPPITSPPNTDARAEGGKGGLPTEKEGTPASSPFSAPGNMSFSSSHVLPHEKATLAEEPPQGEVSNNVSSSSRGPEAISVIKPRGDQFGFRGKSSGGDFDAPRVVNLRGQKS